MKILFILSTTAPFGGSTKSFLRLCLGLKEKKDIEF